MQEEKDELMKDISSAIVEIQRTKETQRTKSLSRHNPDKVAKILYLHSLGCSQTNMIRRHGLSRSTIVGVLADYADYTNGFRELGGQLAARSYLNLESLEEDVIEGLREKLEQGYVPEFKDLKEISIAKSNSQRQAMIAKGEATQHIKVENRVATIDDVQNAAQEALRHIKQAEVIEDES